MKKKILALALMCCMVVASFCSCFTTIVHGDDEHVYGEWEVETPSTCKKRGTEIQRCECGATLKRNLDYAAHNWENGVCTSCNLSLFDELYSLIEKNGTYFENLVYDGYEYVVERDGVEYTIKTEGENWIGFQIIDYTSDTRYRSYSITINEERVATGNYYWTLAYMADSSDSEPVWGRIYGMSGTFNTAQYTKGVPLEYSTSTYPTEQTETQANNASIYTSNIIIVAFMPLLELSENNITVSDFGFTCEF